MSRKPKKAKLKLGDAIDSVTTATGIKKLVEFIAGEDCGCNERREKLNKIQLPIRAKAHRCFNEEQYKQFGLYRERRTLKSWQPEDIKLLIDLYAHVFAIQYDITTLCVNCDGSGKILFKLDEQLEIIYNSYEN